MPVDDAGLRRDVVRVELDHLDPGSTGGAAGCDGLVHRPRTGGQHDGRAGGEPGGNGEPDLAASAEDRDDLAHSTALSSSSLARLDSRPSSSIDSNSGGDTLDPVIASRTGPKANLGLMPSPSTSAARSASWMASVRPLPQPGEGLDRRGDDLRRVVARLGEHVGVDRSAPRRA